MATLVAAMKAKVVGNKSSSEVVAKKTTKAAMWIKLSMMLSIIMFRQLAQTEL